MMNKRIFFFISFYLFLGFFNVLYCNPNIKNELKGVELCDEIYSFLNENNFEPEIQNLLINGKNNFPYNIVINIRNNDAKRQNIIFTFYQEDVLSHKESISDFINYVKQQNYDFNTTLLFSYGERQNVEKQGMIYGVNAFLNTINTNDDYSNIILDLSSSENSINTNSKGIIAPSWLIQNEYNAYIKNDIDENIPYFYLSQMYTYNFFYNRLLTAFFEYNIPSIKLNFTQNEVSDDIIFSVLKESIDSYNSDKVRIWDHHFFMARINNHFKKLTEERTVLIIITIVFVWLMFIFLLVFINGRLKKQAWGTIKHIWYVAPVTFILAILGFTIGKYVALAFFQTESTIHNVFILAETQVIISFILISMFYAITLFYNYWFYERSIDYLIVISCFINQSFFILIDISLFPIFMSICLLSIIALSVRSNGVHIAIFFVMTIPFLPYILSMLNYADFETLYNFLLSKDLISFFVPLTLYPSFLIYFRILTSIRRKTKINIQILISLIVIGISLIIVLLGTLKGESLKDKKERKEEVFLLVTSEDLIHFDYYDKMVFDDLVRTIKINFTEQPEQCNVFVTSGKASPILYTENDFEYANNTTSVFRIPSTPPKTLEFSYGTADVPSIITISAVFPTGNNLDYKTTKKVIKIEK